MASHEGPHLSYRLSEEASRIRVDELQSFLEDQTIPDNFEIDDAYTYVLNAAMAEEISVNPVFRERFTYLAAVLPDVAPKDIVRRSYKIFKHMEMDRLADSDPEGFKDFPRGYASAAAWHPTFEQFCDNTSYGAMFEVNMRYTIAANESERSKVPVWVSKLLDLERHNEVHVGGSLGYGAQHAARYLEPGLAYKDVAAVQIIEGEEMIASAHATVLNNLSHTPGYDPAKIVSLDLIYGDQNLERKAERDTYYIGEELNAAKKARNQQLRENPSDKVHMMYGDATDEKLPEQVTPHLEPGRDTMVVFGTILNQLLPREREKAIAVGRKLGELLLVVDFAGLEDGELIFPQDRPRGTYAAMLLDLRQKDPAWQRLMRFDSGRVRTVMLGEAALALPAAKRHGLAA